MKKTTRERVRKAEADYRAAGKLNRGRDRLHDQCCFFCQQSAEKYLKALMEELGLTIPRTHILKDLLTLLHPFHPSLSRLRRGLVFLTRFAASTRYPGGSASKREAAAALRWAEKVRAAARGLFGLPLGQRRRRK
jgi:HEPN domain-containing protein